MKTFFKSCSIYRKSKGFYLFGYLRTPYGGIGRPPLTNLPLTADAADIGNVVLQIFGELSGEITDVDLASVSATFRQHLKDVGFKNVGALEKNASVVGLEFDGNCYSVIATRKDEHGANVDTSSKNLPRTSTAEEIGNAVLATLDDNH